ncbi:MAG: Cu(I)-responsive transcriptional regulator [Methylophilaceae bacterium]|nr:Cu(I)-responsive transcriptional regulator [Methylophilaceae bacterium]
MQSDLYNIGEAAIASCISSKMIRRYEESGLIPKASRSLSDYRVYNGKNVNMLRFIKHARDLGFSVKQISSLLNLWTDQARSSSEVKSLATEHILLLDQKLKELNTMKSELTRLVSCCHGDERPDCPILDSLAQNEI